MRIQHQRAGDRQHLPLPAREPAGPLARTLAQHRKHPQHLVDPLLEVAVPAVAAHLQVLADRKRGEDILALRHIAHPRRDHPRRVQIAHIAPRQAALARHIRQRTHQPLDQRRFARPVRSDDRHDLVRAHLQIDIVNDVDAGDVARRQAANLHQRLRAVGGKGRVRRPGGLVAALLALFASLTHDARPAGRPPRPRGWRARRPPRRCPAPARAPSPPPDGRARAPDRDCAQ